MEYCDGGTVANRLKSKKGGVFTDSEAVRFARQILSALGYMHAKGFVRECLRTSLTHPLTLSKNRYIVT